MKSVIALVDCNSFYCSCERIFRPDLKNHPIVVLSNNDGCIVAMTKEAKSLGIKRGVPLFKVQNIIDNNDIAVFSSNYELYADISNRIKDTLTLFAKDIENYSIDEAFLDLTGFYDVDTIAQNIKDTIYKHVGVPVSVGIGETKTLAKLANKIAKNYKGYNGYFNIINHKNIGKIFKSFAVFDIWNIGYNYATFLMKNNIFTIYDLVRCDDDWIKKKLTIKGLHTVWELRKIPSIPFEVEIINKKEIISSRSFGHPIEYKSHIMQAVAYHASIAAKKLREQKSLCKSVGIILSTNRFKDEPQYSIIKAKKLNEPLCYSPDIVNIASSLINKVFKTGYKYKKCGVILSNIIKSNNIQYNLFADSEFINKKEQLSKTIDTLNYCNGLDSLHIATFNRHSHWRMKRSFKSPNYTTSWQELPMVK